MGQGRARAVVLGLGSMVAAAAAPPAWGAGTLYDASVGTFPESQGWRYVPDPNAGPVSRSVGGGVATLDTSAARGDRAGYPSRLPTIGGFEFPNHPLIGSLDRTVGFTVRIDGRVVSEGRNARDDNNDGLDDRAGFSVLVVTSDLRAIELGFFEDRVWAQDDDLDGPGELFTQAEGAAIDTTVARTWEVSVGGEIYRVFADGAPVLGGRLRDYTSAGGLAGAVYSTADLIFWGDNTGSADSVSEVSLVTLTGAPVEGPACTGDVDWNGVTDVFDFAALAENFGEPVVLGTGGDLDLDGDVDVFDFAELADGFGCVGP